MSNATLTTLTALARVGGASALNGLGATLRSIGHRIGDFHRRRVAIHRLHALNDHMLKDIGLSRGTIEAAVHGQSRRG
ncbi:MAG: DUF1127 domain-containing protein [Thermohalobaculum sp.]|nr:DUF1127 domain-containing protein [Thermohalobaculum sp.]